MKVKYIVLGLAVTSLLAAGCNKQTSVQNNQPNSPTKQASGQTSSSTGDEMKMNGTSTEGGTMMASGTEGTMIMNGTSTMMHMDNGTMMATSSANEMMQK